MKTSFGQRLRELREQAGLSADQLAALSGVTQGSIHGYEREAISPTLASVQKLAVALKVDIGTFHGVALPPNARSMRKAEAVASR